MGSDDRFKQSVVLTLAKRSAYRCASPECGAITSGPTDEPNGSVNLGEAAHIYGANPGSARYDEKMTSFDRRSITNAIWLCGNCHKKIDNDTKKYPSGLLFEWQREHEKKISEQLGKTAALIRSRYENRHLDELGKLSYLAERLILEKNEYWEYLLTAEALRFETSTPMQRWTALKNGLYTKSITRLKNEDSIFWFNDKLEEILLIVAAFRDLTNIEINKAWGEQGVAGSDTDIINTCKLYGEVCQNALIWEEEIHFTRTDKIFSDLRNHFIGVAGSLIEQIYAIPKFLSETISKNPTSGTHEHNITISLPDDWEEKVGIALEKIKQSISS